MVGCPGCVDQPANAKKAQAMGIALQAFSDRYRPPMLSWLYFRWFLQVKRRSARGSCKFPSDGR